jgi:DNA (cytosine-5)-methyltransferase 1
VEAVTGGELAWVAETDPDASRVLAHRWPGVPNYGDIGTVDWTAAEPVGVLTAGYPCTPFSLAGKRLGAGDDRHVWPHIAAAIAVLRPALVVLENVRGHLTLGFDAVLGDLADMGYDVVWQVAAAAEAGAPHQRKRLFILGVDSGRQDGPRGRAQREPLAGAG